MPYNELFLLLRQTSLNSKELTIFLNKKKTNSQTPQGQGIEDHSSPPKQLRRDFLIIITTF